MIDMINHILKKLDEIEKEHHKIIIIVLLAYIIIYMNTF